MRRRHIAQAVAAGGRKCTIQDTPRPQSTRRSEDTSWRSDDASWRSCLESQFKRIRLWKPSAQLICQQKRQGKDKGKETATDPAPSPFAMMPLTGNVRPIPTPFAAHWPHHSLPWKPQEWEQTLRRRSERRIRIQTVSPNKFERLWRREASYPGVAQGDCVSGKGSVRELEEGREKHRLQWMVHMKDALQTWERQLLGYYSRQQQYIRRCHHQGQNGHGYCPSTNPYSQCTSGWQATARATNMDRSGTWSPTKRRGCGRALTTTAATLSPNVPCSSDQHLTRRTKIPRPR